MDEKTNNKKIEFDFNSKKFFILLGLICILFIVIVINAFVYLPKDDEIVQKEQNTVREEYVNQNHSEEQTKTENIEATGKEETKPVKKGLNIKLPTAKDNVEFVEIETPEGANSSISEDTTQDADKNIAKPVEASPEEKAEIALKSAKKFIIDKQFVKALDEYQKIPTLTSDKNILAESYEGISTVYAINKRYGTALSYAIKAYNTYPTSMREILLARLYYKTGDIQKATQRVNNVLRREFADDRW